MWPATKKLSGFGLWRSVEMHHMKRVMIVGGPGSGKSTLARQLGAITGLPVFHMDHIHWKPHWVERDRADKDLMTRVVHAKDSWIF